MTMGYWVRRVPERTRMSMTFTSVALVSCARLRARMPRGQGRIAYCAASPGRGARRVPRRARSVGASAACRRRDAPSERAQHGSGGRERHRRAARGDRARRVGRRARAHQGGVGRGQHRLRPGRHRRRGRPRRFARAALRATRLPPATGCATKPPCGCWSRAARATSPSCSPGARPSIATPTAGSALGREAAHTRAPRAARARRARAARSAACSGSAPSGAPRVRVHRACAGAVADRSRDGVCVGVRYLRRRRACARFAPARRCSRPAAPARCIARRPTPRWRPATASRWRGWPARASPISSSCSSIRPRSTCRGGRASCCRRRCAARARGW